MIRDQVEEQLLGLDGFETVSVRLTSLDKYRWYPEIVLRHSASGYTVGVHIARTKLVEERLLGEASRAQHEQEGFAVIVAAHLDAATEELEGYCRELELGLYLFTRNGMTRVVPARYELVQELAPPAGPLEGWIPEAIAAQCSLLKGTRYGEVIDNSLSVLTKAATSVGDAISAVRTAAEEIIGGQEKYLCEILPVYRLAVMENIVRLSEPRASEHVVHSFRVFVTGSVIVEYFREFFQGSWNSLGTGQCALEDVWFIMSMFHDCGYARDPERSRRAAEAVEALGGDLREETETGARLRTREYQVGSQSVASLLAHIARGSGGEWDFGSLSGSLEDNLAEALFQRYERLDSHGVAGALDLAADMVRRVRGASEDESVNRPLLASSVYPAAAGIALHDAAVWEELSSYGLFPLHAERFPLGALLLYLDTWDDHRRRLDGKDLMRVASFELGESGCMVVPEWYDSDRMSRKRAEYHDYRAYVVWPAEVRLEIDEGDSGGGA